MKMVRFLNHNEIIRLRRRRRRRRLILALLWIRNNNRNACVRRWHIRPIFLDRQVDGSYYNLIPQMRLSDPDAHFNYFRMSKEVFDSILHKVEPLITNQNSKFRNNRAIPAGLKLAVTLRYLASGDLMSSFSFNYLAGKSTVSTMIRESCNAIWNTLVDDVLVAPNSVDDFKKIADEFYHSWNFPNCLGAIDGKHVIIEAPANSGSLNHNYKKTFSVVLMAICDANYKFTFVDIGAAGRQNNGKTFADSSFGQAILNNELPVPETINVYNYKLQALLLQAPVFVADEAFPLRVNIMRPYANRNLTYTKRIYNYRLSRARCMIENVFGILAARWRVFRKPIKASKKTLISIIKACVCLHNLLQDLSNKTRENNGRQYCPPGLVDEEDGDGNVIRGQWRQMEANGLGPVHLGANNHTRAAAQIRDELATYFTNEGRVEWQDRMLEIGLERGNQ